MGRADANFANRGEAGEHLAGALEPYRGSESVVVGMARGGVAVGFSVAKTLSLPLRVLVVRKLGAPLNPELAIGAVSETGVVELDYQTIRATGASAQYIDRETAEQIREAERRQKEYAIGPGLETVRGRTAIITDDGIATGASALVAVRSARELGASKVVLAAPVSSRPAVQMLRPRVDQLVVLAEPDPFLAVGLYYREFDQVTDAQVIGFLRRAHGAAIPDHEVSIQLGSVWLGGILSVPRDASGLVVFAHGSGSGRHSPRNIAVARQLQEAGLATLLLDLLTEDESRDRRLVFDIGLLTSRLLAATRWAEQQDGLRSLRIGYFGASTGAGAALVASAQQPNRVQAVVSRGGRPDLAGATLQAVQAPTMLIVGGADGSVIDMNEQALGELHGPKEMVIIPGATHLFEEPGALEQVAKLATEWFLRYLPAS